MLHMSEIGEKIYLNFPTWYISVMLIISYFFYALLRVNKTVFLTLIAPAIIFVGGGYYANNFSTILPWYDYNGLFNIGWIRAMVDISIGCLAFQAYCYLKTALQHKGAEQRWRVFLSVFEPLICLRIGYVILTHKNGRNDFWDVFLFAILIVINFLQISFLSKQLSNRFSKFLGKMSLTIYLNQIFIFRVFLSLFGTAHSFTKSLVAVLIIMLFGSGLIYAATDICMSFIKRMLREVS